MDTKITNKKSRYVEYHEMRETANRVYRDMALLIQADTTIADSVMGRGRENRALLKAIKTRLNEVSVLAEEE
tara:strand:- start:308 stop:523 length:216 start_codon:yes stop_codon:yes gene_type:complete